MMSGGNISFLVFFKHWKVNDPRERKFVRIIFIAAEIGLVRGVFFDRLFIGNARKGGSSDFFLRIKFGNKFDEHFFGECEDFFLGYKRHFIIKLCEFRLAVSSCVLIPKAACNLEILFKSRNHLELFELLGRLGEDVKFTVLESGGDDVFTRSFGRAFHHDWRFYLYKIVCMHVFTEKRNDLVAHADVLLQSRTAKVEVAIFKTNVFANIAAVAAYVERRSFSLIQYLYRKNFELDFSVRLVHIHHSFRTGIYFSCNFYNPFRAKRSGNFMGVGMARKGDHLYFPGRVAKVEKNQFPMVASHIYPAREAYFLADFVFCVFNSTSLHRNDYIIKILSLES